KVIAASRPVGSGPIITASCSPLTNHAVEDYSDFYNEITARADSRKLSSRQFWSAARCRRFQKRGHVPAHQVAEARSSACRGARVLGAGDDVRIGRGVREVHSFALELSRLAVASDS